MEGAGAAAIVPDAPLLNMLAAAAEPVDAAQPDELPAVPTAVGVAPDDEADGARVFPNDPRYLSACSIQPGCAKYTLAGWQPSSEKPAKKHLILAMGTRQLLPLEKQPQPASWPVQKIADWLYKHPPTAAGPLVPAQLVPLDAGGGSGSSPLAIAGAAGGPAVPDSGKQKDAPPPGAERWAQRSQGCRMITLIAQDDDLREGFLAKDAKFATRAEKDIGDRDSCASCRPLGPLVAVRLPCAHV